MFDIRLIPEFSGVGTNLPIMELTEKIELVCELCNMRRIERILPLQLRGRALAVYRQLSKQQMSDVKQIKQAL